MKESSLWASQPSIDEDDRLWPITLGTTRNSFRKEFEEILQCSDEAEKKLRFIELLQLIALQPSEIIRKKPLKYLERNPITAVNNIIYIAIFYPEIETFVIANVGQEILLDMWSRLTSGEPPLQKISPYYAIKMEVVSQAYKLGVNLNQGFSAGCPKKDLTALVDLMVDLNSWHGLTLRFCQVKAKLTQGSDQLIIKEYLDLINRMANYYLSPGHMVRAYQLYHLITVIGSNYPDELNDEKRNYWLLEAYKSILLAQDLESYSASEYAYVRTSSVLPNDLMFQDFAAAKSALAALSKDSGVLVNDAQELAKLEFENIKKTLVQTKAEHLTYS